jgi:putative membrane protein (TIGR04086 family)
MDNARIHQAKISNPQKRGLFASIIYSMLFTLLFSFAFILVLTLIAYKNPDPTRLVIPFSYIGLIIASFVSGFSGARLRGAEGLLSGILSGACFSLLLFVLSQFIKKDASLPFSFVLFSFVCVVLVSALGGLFASKKKKQKRRTRR